MKNNKHIIIALTVLTAILLLFVIISPYLFSASYDLDMKNALQAPNSAHLFGSDNLGRDLFGRSFIGLRLSLALALVIQITCLFMGAIFGTISGYYGGVIDKVYIMIQDVVMSFPSLIASLCLIAMLGPGIHTLIIALSCTGWVTYARLIRSEVVSLKELDYIQGARAIGASSGYVLFRHILPNVLRPLIPLFTLMIGHTVLAISGLGFLGFGVQPPTAEIGLMIKDGLTYITRAPWMILAPGLLLCLYVWLLNALGDELQEWLNPKKDYLHI
jgi:peptide/nickel transport system permease protein